ncbi:MAG TPA: hypothetical protein VMW34_18200, partial [Anaerolineales bacterium]|nr:hypothetical protein [Anaerolineales bacterium]
MIAATEESTIHGPVQNLINILTAHPFNYNYRSPQGKRSVDRIIENINAIGDIGYNYVNILASGRLNEAHGFPRLVTQLENRDMIITTYPVLVEALRMISGGFRVNNIRFEDTEPAGIYDIDIGVLNPRSGYSMVNQVKLTTQTGVRENLNSAMRQLINVRASRKVIVLFVSGITFNNYSLTLNRQIEARVAGSRFIVDIVLV